MGLVCRMILQEHHEILEEPVIKGSRDMCESWPY